MWLNIMKLAKEFLNEIISKLAKKIFEIWKKPTKSKETTPVPDSAHKHFADDWLRRIKRIKKSRNNST